MYVYMCIFCFIFSKQWKNKDIFEGQNKNIFLHFLRYDTRKWLWDSYREWERQKVCVLVCLYFWGFMFICLYAKLISDLFWIFRLFGKIVLNHVVPSFNWNIYNTIYTQGKGIIAEIGEERKNLQEVCWRISSPRNIKEATAIKSHQYDWINNT